MWITRVSINNPVFATMVMIGIAVLGLFAYNRLRVEQMPDVSLPFVLVLTTYPGASPEVVESDVTKPLEYAINTVSGASLIRSNSKEGRSEVFAEFRMSTDMMKAMQDVRDKIGQVRPGFPRDVKDPLVLRIEQENAQPVVSLAVLSPTMTLRDLTSLTDQTIVKALENVPGVARDRRQRPGDAADPGPDQAQRRDVARHRRRPGDQRDPRREPGRPGGTHHARADRLDRARRRQDQGSGAVRPDHRRAAGRRAGLPVAGRGRHRRREGGGRRSRGSTAGRRSRSTSRSRRTRTSSTPAAASPRRSRC